jgi:hypothetical protein
VSGAPDLTFAVPGRLDTLTGGFLYDRRIVEGLRGLGLSVEALELPDGFPLAGAEVRNRAAALLQALPDGRPLVVDGLAAGALPEAMAALAARLPLHLLVHHPLAAETASGAASPPPALSSRRPRRRPRRCAATTPCPRRGCAWCRPAPSRRRWRRAPARARRRTS